MILETFEEALSNLDAEGEDKHGDDWPELVRDRLLALEGEYRILTNKDRVPIDYSELSTQAAYLFAYAMPRAGFTYERLKAHRAHYGGPLFSSKHLNVASVGGGPASELVGLLEYLADSEMGEDVSSIDYTIYDRDEDWEDVANLVAESATSDIEVSLKFKRLDLTDKAAVSKTDFSDEDLVIFSYVISEVCAFEGKFPVEENVRSLLKTLDSGALVLYLDSESYHFYSFFNSCKSFIKGLRQNKDIGSNCVFDPGEYDGVFAEFCEAFDREPRLDCNIVSKLLKRD